MSHESVWYSRPRTFGKGSRQWYFFRAPYPEPLVPSGRGGYDMTAIPKPVPTPKEPENPPILPTPNPPIVEEPAVEPPPYIIDDG